MPIVKRILLSIVIVLAFAFDIAHSATVQIQRLSDTQAVITGTGSIGAVAPEFDDHILSLGDVFGTAPTGTDAFNIFGSSSLMVGSTPIDFAWEIGPNFTGSAELYFGNDLTSFAVNSTLSGSLQVTLLGGTTFASVGTTGTLSWGLNFNSEPVSIGTWEIVAVAPIPIPAALPLFATALAGMGLIGWRRKMAAA